MDQNSSNGAGKRNWREKLGIGAKDIPKIADDFKGQKAEPRIPPKPQGAAARPAQPVARPAPMAPRAGAAPVANAGPRLAVPPKVNGPDSLAERLKAQRQAAERLAEQRVASARDKPAETPKRPAPEPQRASPPARRAGGEKPKFTFADEELAAARREAPGPAPLPKPAPAPPRPTISAAPTVAREFAGAFQPKAPPVPPPPIVPPRPALGGERAVPLPDPRPRPSTGYQPHFTPPPQPAGYRPLDPPSFQPRPTIAPPRGYGQPATPAQREPGYGEARPGTYEGYRRPPPAEEEEAEDIREEPRLQRARRAPPRAKPPAAYDDDLDDVFETQPPPPPRRRAGAKDYSKAYREFEEGSGEDDKRRSGGPLILLALLLLAAVVAAGGVWYWQTQMTSEVTLGTSGSVPVIAPPEQPAKSQPENNATTGATLSDPAVPSSETRKKQIYDRILGDQAIESDQMLPTEEIPVQPPGEAQPGDPEGNVEPMPGEAAPATAAPQPDAAEPLPLPLPLPPPAEGGNTQGSLEPAGGPPPAGFETAQSTESAKVALNAPSSGGTSIAPAAAPLDAPPPIPEPALAVAEPALPAPAATESAAIETQASPPSTDTPAPAIETAKSKKKAKTAKKQRREPQQESTDVALGAEPVVLVPPSNDVPMVLNSVSEQPEPAQAGRRSGSFFSGNSRPAGKRGDDVSSGGQARTNFNSGAGAAAPAVQEQPEAEQIAAIDPQSPPPEPSPQAPSTRSGYSVQLASFRSEAEALAEMDRLRSRHPDILGALSSRISQGTVSGTTRYRLRAGGLASRGDAQQVCNSLIAAGERDCNVLGP